MNKTYDPKSFEDRIYKKWLDKKYFNAKPDKNKKPFTIVIPPPNITGQLHMGHALNDTIQDAIIRYKRMKGFEALWLPGTDHASIATEVKIVEKCVRRGLAKTASAETALKRAYEWKDKYGGRIVEQLKKMGFSCDWDRLAFTMDERLSKAVREVFVNMYEKALFIRATGLSTGAPIAKRRFPTRKWSTKPKKDIFGTLSIRCPIPTNTSSLRPPVPKPCWAIPQSR